MSVHTFTEQILKAPDKQITVKFFLNGDEEGNLNTMDFETEEAYQEWYVEMSKSVEIFSMGDRVVERHPGIVTDKEGIQRFDDETQTKDNKKADLTMYVLTIIDEGLQKRMVIHSELEVLASLSKTAIRRYLDENGMDIGAKELYTEDGYAKIVIASSEDPEADETVWSYSFDGDGSLDDAIATLLRKNRKRNSTC